MFDTSGAAGLRAVIEAKEEWCPCLSDFQVAPSTTLFAGGSFRVAIEGFIDLTRLMDENTRQMEMILNKVYEKSFL